MDLAPGAPPKQAVLLSSGGGGGLGYPLSYWGQL
jgi:hypothetical protein